jgi:hypothetical protein
MACTCGLATKQGFCPYCDKTSVSVPVQRFTSPVPPRPSVGGSRLIHCGECGQLFDLIGWKPGEAIDGVAFCNSCAFTLED